MSWQTKLHPVLAQKLTQLLKNLAALRMDVRVVQSLRTFKEQDDLYAKGRSLPGKRVTNARGGFSNHNYGLAADLCPFKDGKPDWNDRPAFKTIGREAKKLGLEWGGDWKFVDMPHVQLRGMSIKDCQVYFRKGGLAAVWKRMDELLAGAKPTVYIPKDDQLIEYGDRGDAVRRLQENLASLGFLHEHEIDAEFGKITKRAVTGFQRQHGLTADGIVGPGTQAKIKQAIEAKKQAFIPAAASSSSPSKTAHETPAEVSAIDSPQIPPVSEPSPDKAIETKQTATTENANQTVEETVSQVNEQDVNQTEPIESPSAYNGVGFWGTIKKDLLGVFGANASVQTAAEYSQQVQASVPASLLTKLAYLVAAISIGYLVFRAVHYLVDRWQQNQRARTQAQINTDVTRKNMEWK